MPRKPGPHLVTAVLCEKVLQEQDGVLSIIRMIDRIIVTVTGKGVPSQMPAGQFNLTLVVCLKSGDAHGRHTLRMVPELPSGELLQAAEVPVLFEGEDRGVNTIIQFVLPIQQEGIHWFDIYLGVDQHLTRVPLRVLYQPMQAMGPG